MWHQQVVERNNALAGKRTDILYHKVDVEVGLTPKTMDVAIVEDKSAKPKIYPSISAVMEQEEASVGNQAEQVQSRAEQSRAEQSRWRPLWRRKIAKTNSLQS